MNKEKIEYYSHLTVFILGVGIFLYLFLKYMLFSVLPFLIAWTIAFALRPFARRISNGTHIPCKIISVLLTLLILVGGLSVIATAIAYALGEAWNFLRDITESDALYNTFLKIINPLGGLLGDKEGAAELEVNISEAVKSALTSLLSGLLEALTAFASNIPRVLLFILITVISSVYFSLDLDRINSFVIKALPKKISSSLISFKNRFLKTLLKYLRAYLIIMLVTFITMLFGFLVLRVKYAVLFAFIVALLDALPLIGVGTVLVPWSVYQLIFGKSSLGIGLLILFVLNTVIRQFIEPKIVGKNLGIHPVVSLILLYIGYTFLGFFGLLLVPVFTVVINILSKKEEITPQEK